MSPRPRQPPLEKELLDRVYTRSKRSIADVARTLGVSPRRVGDSLDFHDIPRHAKAPRDKTFVNADVVIYLYVEKEWAYGRIAQLFGVGHQRIREVLDAYDVPIRKTAPEDRKPQRAWVRFEDVPVRKTFDGRVLTKTVAILECGHRSPIRRTALKVTDPTTLRFGCAACAKREEQA
jgi:hypothetical protein